MFLCCEVLLFDASEGFSIDLLCDSSHLSLPSSLVLERLARIDLQLFKLSRLGVQDITESRPCSQRGASQLGRSRHHPSYCGLNYAISCSFMMSHKQYGDDFMCTHEEASDNEGRIHSTKHAGVVHW